MNIMDTFDRPKLRFIPETAIDELKKQRLDDSSFREESETFKGYCYVSTANHGFLWIPKDDKYFKIAKQYCSEFSYKVKGGMFLEEDADATKFLRAVA